MKLRTLSHLLKKSLLENFIFRAVQILVLVNWHLMNQFQITWEIKTFEWKNFCISSIERHTVSGSDQTDK